jgi:hypothetical protein
VHSAIRLMDIVLLDMREDISGSWTDCGKWIFTACARMGR